MPRWTNPTYNLKLQHTEDTKRWHHGWVLSDLIWASYLVPVYAPSVGGPHRYLEPLCRQTNDYVRELLKQDLTRYGQPTISDMVSVKDKIKSTFNLIHDVSR